MTKFLMIINLLVACYTSKAQVGIGTNTPNPNAALDITSTNKGLLLPRVADTNMINNPSAGLMVYDMNTNSPSVYNGTNWRNLATTAATQDSITYTITNAIPGFTNGTYKLISAKQGLITSISPPFGAKFDSITIVKEMDINSVAFIRLAVNPSQLGTMTMEIKFYKAGSTTPYYSIKAVTLTVSNYMVNNGAGQSFTELVSIKGVTYGFKNWIDNISFAWHTNNNNSVPY